MEAPPEPRSRRRARALPPQHGPAMASHVASTWPRPCCTAQPPPAALYARTTVRLRLWVPSMGTDKMPVRPGRPCAAMAMATRLMAETGMMMPASGSDGSCWSKVAEMQQLRMPPHERQWSTTLLALSRSRTPPSRSQHLHSCTLEDRVAARISLLGRGCGALGAERENKTSERLFRPFCPLLDPPRFRTSPAPYTHPRGSANTRAGGGAARKTACCGRKVAKKRDSARTACRCVKVRNRLKLIGGSVGHSSAPAAPGPRHVC